MLDERFDTASSFSEGGADVCERFTDSYGYIDTTGAWRIEPRFEGTTGFVDGIAAAREGSAWGLIEPGGTRYVELGTPAAGRVAVRRGKKWGIVDSKATRASRSSTTGSATSVRIASTSGAAARAASTTRQASW